MKPNRSPLLLSILAAVVTPSACIAQEALPTQGPTVPGTRNAPHAPRRTLRLPYATSQPPPHVTARQQMQAAREQRATAEANRKALGQSIQQHIHDEHNDRLTREGQVGPKAEEDRARVQEEVQQIRTQVQTRHSGGMHTTDPALDWRGIATTSGQLNAVETAERDPTLTFDGAAGEPYLFRQYLTDRTANDDPARVRSTFFAHPYFFRDGVRYQRTTVLIDGKRYYQFVRR